MGWMVALPTLVAATLVASIELLVRSKGSELTEPFNKALEELIADGTVQKIVDKYISAN